MGRKRKRVAGTGGRGGLATGVARDRSGTGSRPDPTTRAGNLRGKTGRSDGSLATGSPQLLRQVGMEVLRDQLDPVAWAQALVESQGSRDDAISRYARFRLESLAAEECEQSGKKTNLEARRRESFRDYKSVPSFAPGDLAERNVFGFIDAMFWHLVAMVGMMGCALAAGLLWPGLKLSLSWQTLVAVLVAMQLIPVVGWWAGRGMLHGVSYAQAAQMAACLAMFGSLALGFNLLLAPSQEQSAILAQGGQTEEATPARKPVRGGGLAGKREESPEPRGLVTTEED